MGGAPTQKQRDRQNQRYLGRAQDLRTRVHGAAAGEGTVVRGLGEGKEAA